MRLFLKYIFIFTISLNLAQTGRYWNSSNTYNIGYFDSSNSIQPNNFNIFPKSNENGNSQFCFSSFNGDPLFIGSTLSCFKIDGNKIENYKNSYIPNGSIGLQTSEKTWTSIGYLGSDTSIINGNGFYKLKKRIKDEYCQNNNCFDSILNFNRGFYINEYTRDSNNIIYTKTKMKYLDLGFYPKNLIFTDIKRIKDFEYNLIAIRNNSFTKNDVNINSTLYLLKYFNNSLILIDSFEFNSSNYISDSIKVKIKDFGGSINLSAKLSRSRDKIIYTLNIGIEFNVNLNYLYKKELLGIININSKINEIIYENEINNNLFTSPKWEYITFSNNVNLNGDAFSSNDSLFYIPLYKYEYNFGIIKKIKLDILAWKYRENNFLNSYSIFTKNVIDTDKFQFSLFSPSINPYGGLTFYLFDYSNNSDLKTVFYHLKDINNSKSKINFQNFNINNTQLGNFSYLCLRNYDYLRIKIFKPIYKECKAFVNIKNISDTSFGFNRFKWFIYKNNNTNIYDSFLSKNINTLTFNNSGKYFIKLLGYSEEKKYSELYLDTILINIPKKNGVNFYSKDTIVCRYKGLEFYNHSYSKDTIYNKYLWHFGDGNTSSLKNPIHTFSKPGLYSVSLFYSNGYCDSTLVKNQYIKVVDAPKPGFNVNDSLGCSPFTLNVTDTVTLNVKEKEYYYSDINQWVKVSTNQPNFNHLFINKGRYKVVQRLTGYSGCITQNDSIWVRVTKGLTSNDSLHVFNSTIVNEKALVYWKKLDGAVEYKLFKNNSPYFKTTDTFFNDDKLYKNDAIYSVYGIDSCNNTSSIGRIGKPIYLTGKMQGFNSSSKINFSKYLEWPANPNSYKVKKLINNNWIEVNSQLNNFEYEDFNFVLPNELQSCYLIEAINSNNSLTSQSNVFCIPYRPNLFIPNSFTPNNDGVNDKFEPIGVGIKHFNIKIYNRWGEIIFEGKDNEAWDGLNAFEGVYKAYIQYETNLGTLYYQSTTVSLLK